MSVRGRGAAVYVPASYRSAPAAAATGFGSLQACDKAR